MIAQRQKGSPAKDASLPIPDQVTDLLSRMTLEETVEQLKWGWQQKVDFVDPTGTYKTESARPFLWGREAETIQAMAGAVMCASTTSRNFASQAGCAGHAGPVTRLPSTSAPVISTGT